MEEKIIDFKTEKLAKEKGFDFSNMEIRDSKTLKVADNVKARLTYFGSIKKSNLIQRPTQSLLQKWLRDAHDIQIMIDFDNDYSVKLLKRSKSIMAGGFESYEDSLEHALQTALNKIEL